MNEKIENLQQKLEAFTRVLETMETLRVQCPWDRKQTFESLRSHSIEEVYELSEAVMSSSYEKIREELGDLLLHLVFYAKIGEEENEFSMIEICDKLVDKLVERHPHVYGEVIVRDENDVKDNWEKIKLQSGDKTTLGGVPEGLPSMIKAIRIQEKAKGVGFDWDHREQVWDKIQEEMNEFHEEIIQKEMDIEKIEDEFGDVLFSLINYARFFDINPDTALEKTNLKFISRFNIMESALKKEGKSFKNMTLDEMEKYWQKAKEKP
jgi:XTP/dITP diphosphohydrolase